MGLPAAEWGGGGVDGQHTFVACQHCSCSTHIYMKFEFNSNFSSQSSSLREKNEFNISVDV